MANSGFTQTFAELDAGANRLSHLMRRSGFDVGDHIAICLENNDRYLEVIWGCHYAGLIYTCISSRLTAREIAYIVSDCDARGFITSTYMVDQVSRIPSSVPGLELCIVLDGDIDNYVSYQSAVADESSDPLDEERIAGMDMLYSSGTTGVPKGVLRTFPRAPLEAREGGVISVQDTIYGIDRASVYLSPAPLYHAAPLKFCTAANALGATVIVMERFDADRYLELVATHRVTHSQVVPTMFVRLLRLPAEDRERFDVSSLRCIIHAAAPCPIEVKEAMLDWFGPIIHEYYAGTERNGYVHCDSQMWIEHRGTVGKAVNCTIHIVDDSGKEVPTGSTGTVYFEGSSPFTYHKDPEKTKEAYLASGWSTLGDIGHIDEDGFLYLTDRRAHTIISGGVNIYPQEAENVLLTHPSVLDAAVFGIPNAEFGEEVKAVVLPVDYPTEAIDCDALEAVLIAFCRERLAAVKCPRSIDFKQELPRHPTGKLYKRLLQQEYT